MCRCFRDLRDMVADGRPLTPGATVQAMRPYATEPGAEPV